MGCFVGREGGLTGAVCRVERVRAGQAEEGTEELRFEPYDAHESEKRLELDICLGDQKSLYSLSQIICMPRDCVLYIRLAAVLWEMSFWES